MIFEKIRWKNFLSTGNDFTEITLNTNYTTLIIGENGAGKSTILDAICYVLFNKPFRNVNKPQLVNSVNNKDCLVECEFSINGNSYKVRRGMKPTIFEIYKNDILLNQDSTIKDYQDYFEKRILNRNMKSFCQIEILGSASFVPFMALTTANRRAIVEDLLDLEVFSTMSTILKSNISETKVHLLEQDSKIQLVKDRISNQEEYLVKLNEQSNVVLENCTKEINEKTEELGLLKERLEKLEEELSKLKKEIDENSGLEKKNTDFIKFTNIIKNKLEDAKNSLGKMDNIGECPTCHQNVDSNVYQEYIKKQILKYETNLEKIISGHKEIENDFLLYQSNKKLYTKLDAEEYSIKNNISYLEKEIDKLLISKNQYILEKNLDIIDDDKLEKYREELLELSKEKGNLLTLQKTEKIVASMLKDSGVKAKVISKYIPIINQLINKYLETMEFFASFELDETFKETIKSRHRDLFSYMSFSQGEKMRIDLAILFTWRTISRMRNTHTSNLLIMDEVLDGSLDVMAKDSLMKIIAEGNENVNTIVISHNSDNLGDVFDRTIKFGKTKNFSHIQ